MTKKEIVNTVSEATGLRQLLTGEIVQRILDAIVEGLVEDRRVEFRSWYRLSPKR